MVAAGADAVSMYPHSISIAPRTALTSEGDATYGTAVAYRANVQSVLVLTPTAEGEHVRAPGARIFVPGRPTVNIGDKVSHGSNVYDVLASDPTEPGLPGSTQFYARLV